MLVFWLSLSVFITLFITYMGIMEGFRKWGFYYVFAGLAFLAYITRKWMMKRMEKHVKEMEERNANN